MIRIGLVGESPNDTDSIKNLLLGKYSNLIFKHISGDQTGTQLYNEKTKRIVHSYYEKYKIDFVVYISDMDYHEGDLVRRKFIENWVHNIDKDLPSTGILLLNIHELEALILADIDSFNNHFNSKIKFATDPMKKIKPKEFLMDKTKKHSRTYRESDAPEIFNLLDINKVIEKCEYFGAFIMKFERKISAIMQA